jgi:ribonuclease HII
MKRAINSKPASRLKFECDLWSREFTLVAGVDEAGRGPLAGPVAAAAVILPAASFQSRP